MSFAITLAPGLRICSRLAFMLLGVSGINFTFFPFQVSYPDLSWSLELFAIGKTSLHDYVLTIFFSVIN